MLFCFFSNPQTPHFVVVKKLVPDGIKKCIRKCKNMLKKSFWNTLFAKNCEKGKIDQNA